MAEKTNAFGPDFHVVLGDVILEWWRMRKEKKKLEKKVNLDLRSRTRTHYKVYL